MDDEASADEDESRAQVREALEFEEALRAIRGRGAFRYFKDTMHRHNMLDQWYRQREAAYERIAICWLEAHEIPYARDPGDTAGGP